MDKAYILANLNAIADILNVVRDVYTKCDENEHLLAQSCASATSTSKARHSGAGYKSTHHNIDIEDEEFIKATNVTVQSFNLLLGLLKKKLRRYSNRKPIQPKERLAFTLLYLAQGYNMKVLARRHNLGASTARKIIAETCRSIWEELSDFYLALPTQTEWQRIAELFYAKTGMPNCIGAIDALHVQVLCPQKSISDEHNNQRNLSTILIAACDSNNRFTVVDVAVFGSQCEGGGFAKTKFGSWLLAHALNIPKDRNLPNSAISLPHYFVADSGFPLKSNIMRPYPGRQLSADRSKFNDTLSSARMRIDTTFGMLVGRWRVLSKVINAAPSNVKHIMLATVVLHNFLLRHKDAAYVEGIENCELAKSTTIFPPANRCSSEAFNMREILKNYLDMQKD